MAPAAFFPPIMNGPVCVMDASGQLGSGLVKRLLQKGYTVHAALQNHGDELQLMSDVSVSNCYNKKNKLKIFYADPFDYKSIIDALKGCSALLYNFEPPQDQLTYDEMMAEIEVRAAHNVLEACAQIETIDKVVFTSSVTAVVWKETSKSAVPSDFDERHWSDVNLCRKFKLWYGLSKTLAEKAAWALAMDREVNMVAINAGLLMGPHLSIKNPYLRGAAEMYEDGVLVTVDLDFLVDAHICVLEDVSSYGRYLCFNHVINRPEDALKLASILTTSASPPPPQSFEEGMRIVEQRMSSKKLNKLMVDLKDKPLME